MNVGTSNARLITQEPPVAFARVTSKAIDSAPGHTLPDDLRTPSEKEHALKYLVE